MANNPTIAGALKNSPHIALFDTVASERFNGIETQNLLVFNFDTIDARLLDTLASDFGLLGYNGWILAETEQQKRELLKSAVALKKIMGTPYAIKKFAKDLGIQGEVIIEEGVGFQYNGTYQYDGTVQYGAGNWALFAVKFDATLNPGLTSDRLEMFRRFINSIKPARSKLISLTNQ